MRTAYTFLVVVILSGCSSLTITPTPHGTQIQSTRFLMRSNIREVMWDAESNEFIMYGYTSDPIEMAMQAFNMGLQMGRSK